MEELELKYLASYLPYMVMYKDLIYKDEPVKELTITDLYFNRSNLKNIHLVLRPLSDLTKEIEHNVKKFVPIVELFNLSTQNGNYEIEKYYVENDTAILKFMPQQHPETDFYFVDYFEIDLEPNCIAFSLVNEQLNSIDDEVMDERFYLLGNEFLMYQKLLELHFDVFGLIEKGLAVDVNTI